MPDGGELNISASNIIVDAEGGESARVPGAYVRISVADTGAGISPDALTQIFEPFFSTKPKHQNSGLGLAMVHGAVRQNAGFVEVRSEVGQGTTFDIFWPRAPAGDVPAAAPAERNEAPTSRTRVLIAEDDELLRTLAVRLLRSEGYEVHSAVDGVDAVRVWSKLGRIDLLLTDVVMPNMNGNALAKELTRKQGDLPVLFMSGFTHDIIAEGGVIPPEVEFLAKPFNAEDLFAAVRRLVSVAGGRSAPH